MDASRISLILLAAAAFLLSGCGEHPSDQAEVLTAKIPIAVRTPPPAEIMSPFKPEALPVFIAPSDPRASSCLSVDAERELRLLLHDLKGRLKSCQAWAG